MTAESSPRENQLWQRADDSGRLIVTYVGRRYVWVYYPRSGRHGMVRREEFNAPGPRGLRLMG